MCRASVAIGVSGSFTPLISQAMAFLLALEYRDEEAVLLNEFDPLFSKYGEIKYWLGAKCLRHNCSWTKRTAFATLAPILCSTAFQTPIPSNYNLATSLRSLVCGTGSMVHTMRHACRVYKLLTEAIPAITDDVATPYPPFFTDAHKRKLRTDLMDAVITMNAYARLTGLTQGDAPLLVLLDVDAPVQSAAKSNAKVDDAPVASKAKSEAKVDDALVTPDAKSEAKVDDTPDASDAKSETTVDNALVTPEAKSEATVDNAPATSKVAELSSNVFNLAGSPTGNDSSNVVLDSIACDALQDYLNTIDSVLDSRGPLSVAPIRDARDQMRRRIVEAPRVPTATLIASRYFAEYSATGTNENSTQYIGACLCEFMDIFSTTTTVGSVTRAYEILVFKVAGVAVLDSGTLMTQMKRVTTSAYIPTINRQTFWNSAQCARLKVCVLQFLTTIGRMVEPQFADIPTGSAMAHSSHRLAREFASLLMESGWTCVPPLSDS